MHAPTNAPSHTPTKPSATPTAPEHTLGAPLELRSGLVLSNRIAKAATSERLADATGAPTEALARLYAAWSGSGAGLLITGNVVIAPDGREVPGNVLIEDERHLEGLRTWARRAREGGARVVMQVNHAGRQSPRSATRAPVAPSPVPLRGMFGLAAPPRALEEHEIEALVARFARTASVARAAGFDGVQVHAAHGYLISQFLSPRTNLRQDRWGGSLEGRMRFLLEVIRAVRAATAPEFSISVKLNSADFQRGGFDEEDSMRVVDALEAEGIDFLEISGGNYESPALTGRGSTREREAYFLDYARRVRSRTKLPLMLTGGLRSAEAMADAIDSGAVDLVGLARPMILEPDLPRRLLDGSAARARHDQIRSRFRFLDDLLQATWYARQLRRIAAGEQPDEGLGRLSTVLVEGLRTYGHHSRVVDARAAPVTALPSGSGR